MLETKEKEIASFSEKEKANEKKYTDTPRQLFKLSYFQDASNYKNAHSVASAEKLNQDNVDIIKVVKDYKDAVRKAIGQYPDTLVLGAKPFAVIANKKEVLDRIKYSQKGIVTTDLLASILDLKQVLVGKGCVFAW